jgi:hypothetical protein
MEKWFFILISTIFCLVSCELIQQNEQPIISYKDGNWELVIPKKMHSAIQKTCPKFILWKTSDYTDKILKSLIDDHDSRRAPFALIVDVNKDGILDVILDGHDDKDSLLICVLSEGKVFKTVIITKEQLINPKDIENINLGKKEYGINYFLWLPQDDSKKDKSYSPAFIIAFPQQTDSQGELLRDGDIVNYYFENGVFRAEESPL